MEREQLALFVVLQGTKTIQLESNFVSQGFAHEASMVGLQLLLEQVTFFVGSHTVAV